MEAFKQLVSNVLENGVRYETGKGVCVGLIGAQVTYDISKGLPIVTGKKTNILWAIAETSMFLKGVTHTDFLKKYGAEQLWAGQSLSEDFVHKNAPRNPLAVIEEYAAAKDITFEAANEIFKKLTAEFATKRMELDAKPPMMDDPKAEVLEPVEGSDTPAAPPQIVDQEAYRAELVKIESLLYAPFIEANIKMTEDRVIMAKGSQGPTYGKQWRQWTAVAPNGRVVNIDQLKDVISKLKSNPGSRQVVMTAWNPANIIPENNSYNTKIANGFMGQPPCHVNYHFLTRQNEAGETVLHLVVWLRSNDLMLGHAFNAIGGGFIAHAVAKACGFKPGTLTMQISDAHIYENHIEGAKQYLANETFEQPTFALPDDFDIFNFEVEDVVNCVGEYTHSGYIKFPLNVNDNAMAESKAAQQPDTNPTTPPVDEEKSAVEQEQV